MKKLNIAVITLGMLIALGSIALSMFSFVVNEHQIAFLQDMKKIVRDENDPEKFKVYSPGRHFHIPLIQNPKYIDTRERVFVLTDTFVTKQKKTIQVEYFVPWTVDDYQKFYLASRGNDTTAERQMNRKLNEAVRNQIGKYKILEVSTGTIIALESEDSDLEYSEVISPDSRSYKEKIVGKREQILEDAYNAVSPTVNSDLGIQLASVEFSEINLPKDVAESVYDRMRKERNGVATKFIKQGDKKAKAIRSNADLTVSNNLSVAQNKAIKIRKKADADAAKIYADSYKSAPEFYEFYLALETLPSTFTSEDVFLLSTDSKFLSHLKGDFK
ncbi:protease modulator HflC [Vibrio sp. Makdt]|uniref:protease modulator HflC n=1 Tax=Vibrio sp. Makdt TaxID=2998828 RepID=UPI0022CD1FFF|nr:protease modulator HflC [Vibrio sp. Makdt]MDA0152178.1 protease modulator HflC [Vibrio sp. Makdt]